MFDNINIGVPVDCEKGKRRNNNNNNEEDIWRPRKLIKLSVANQHTEPQTETESSNDDPVVTVTPPASDTESEDNLPVELEKEEKEKIESILHENKDVCTIADAVNFVLECQKMLFPDQDESIGLLVKKVRDVQEQLRDLTIKDLIEKIESMKNELLQSICDEIGFKINWSMKDCRSDEEREKQVEGKNDEELIKQETKTVEITTKLNVISTESRVLIGLITGEFQACHRKKNGRIAIWAQLPRDLTKFYCIGTIRRYQLKGRTRVLRIRNNHDYMVRDNKSIEFLLFILLTRSIFL